MSNPPQPRTDPGSAPTSRPLVIFEDDDLLVIDKPAGWNTHAPAPFAGEGVYDWLRHREPRWADLALMHRLDKATSGLLVFAKSTAANRSLTAQFTDRSIHKHYLLRTDRPVPDDAFTTVSAIRRAGDRYESRPLPAAGERAETRFRVLHRGTRHTVLEAEPVTGRTHQIRVHAAAGGFPILGDTLYGGTPGPRVCLHAARIALRHPVSGASLAFEAPDNFDTDPREDLRAAIIDPSQTDACRLVHGAADGWPGWYVDRFGPFLLSQSGSPLSPDRLDRLRAWVDRDQLRGAYHKCLRRDVRGAAREQLSPELVLGSAATEEFVVRENGVSFACRFGEGYSVGLFLDQRDNRRRLLINHVAGHFPVFEDGPAGRDLLNTFAYTCGFSTAAALAGARVTSLDLSRKYLDWGRRNFELNHLDPASHDFIFGDTFDWLRRFERKGRRFDAVILDPPTFSQSKVGGTFQAERDYGRLVEAAVTVLHPRGVLLASTNAADYRPEDFLHAVTAAVARRGRTVLQQHFSPQPPDFPITREEPAYLKTLWLRIS